MKHKQTNLSRSSAASHAKIVARAATASAAKSSDAKKKKRKFQNLSGLPLIQSDREYRDVLEKMGPLHYAEDETSKTLLESYRAIKNEWEQRRVSQAIERGEICTRCKTNVPAEGHKRCNHCREYSNNFTRSRRNRFIEDGLCMECGAPPDPNCGGKIKYCTFHVGVRNAKNRQRYAEKKRRAIL